MRRKGNGRSDRRRIFRHRWHEVGSLVVSTSQPSVGLLNCGEGKPERSCVGPLRLLVWRRCRPVPEQLSRTIEALYRSESGRVLATLVRLLGDLDLAEESMHEAFAAALESWPQTGIPDNPRPWLISTARFKAIDVMRRRARFDGAQKDLVAHMESRVNVAPLGVRDGRRGDRR